MDCAIFGYSGYLGKNLIQKSKKINFFKIGKKNDSNIFIDLNTLNLKNINFNLIPKKFIFLAGISSPEFCENNSLIAEKINFAKTISLIEILLLKGHDVLFASSDVVYGDSNEIKNELSVLNPYGFYGLLKYKVEQYFINYKNFYVARLSNIFSNEDKFLQYLFHMSNKSENAIVFNDFVRTPIHFKDFLNFIEAFVINKNFSHKVINLCGNDHFSRSDIAKKVSKICNLKYNAIKTPEEFIKYRPLKIKTESIYLNEIIGKERTSLINDIEL